MMSKRLLVASALLAVGLFAFCQTPVFAIQAQIGLYVNTINLGPAIGPNDPGIPVAPTGAFDLNNTAGIINMTGGGTDYQTVRAQLYYAYNGGNWDKPTAGAWKGVGIGSSAAKAWANSDQSIGIATGAEYKAIPSLSDPNHFYGEPAAPNVIPNNWVLVRYTWAGDANLSGQLDPDDYGAIDNQFNSPTGGYFNPASWLQGDFDHDGQLTPDDYGAIDNTFAKEGYFTDIPLRGGNGTPFGAAGAAAVPEPTTLALLFAGAAAALLIWRKNRQG